MSEDDVVECSEDGCDVEAERKYMEVVDDEPYCGLHAIAKFRS